MSFFPFSPPIIQVKGIDLGLCHMSHIIAKLYSMIIIIMGHFRWYLHLELSIKSLYTNNFTCFIICIFSLMNLTFFRNTIRVSNSLNPNQDRHFVCLDLGPRCLLRLSGNDKCCSKISFQMIWLTQQEDMYSKCSKISNTRNCINGPGHNVGCRSCLIWAF